MIRQAYLAYHARRITLAQLVACVITFRRKR